MFGTEAQTELGDLKVVATKSGGPMKYIDRSAAGTFRTWRSVRLESVNSSKADVVFAGFCSPGLSKKLGDLKRAFGGARTHREGQPPEIRGKFIRAFSEPFPRSIKQDVSVLREGGEGRHHHLVHPQGAAAARLREVVRRCVGIRNRMGYRKGRPELAADELRDLSFSAATVPEAAGPGLGGVRVDRPHPLGHGSRGNPAEVRGHQRLCRARPILCQLGGLPP